jgi:hypothetical protein
MYILNKFLNLEFYLQVTEHFDIKKFEHLGKDIALITTPLSQDIIGEGNKKNGFTEKYY